MFSHPSMTSRGRRIALFVAAGLMFFLPKKVDCGYPGGQCAHAAILRQVCTPYELEPVGFWVLEKLLERDVGFAYTTGERCT